MGFARVGSNPTVVDNFLRIVVLEFQVRPCGAMDSASDFGSGGWGFESPQGLFFLLSLFGRTLCAWCILGCDNMAEWLRRQPAKLMGFARVGSNPTVVVYFFCPRQPDGCPEGVHSGV